MPRLTVTLTALALLAACGAPGPTAGPTGAETLSTRADPGTILSTPAADSYDRAEADGVTGMDQAARLAALILSTGPGIDPAEAARAARIALSYPMLLRVEYGVTDPPLIHNTKVNMGTRPRGLCWHWAEDMENRLRAENFQTLRLHRAIANHDKAFRIEHSTVIVSHLGGTMREGVVLDPWRFGGPLYWARVPDDERYDWTPRQEVFEYKRRIAARTGAG